MEVELSVIITFPLCFLAWAVFPLDVAADLSCVGCFHVCACVLVGGNLFPEQDQEQLGVLMKSDLEEPVNH